jgi:hypothetical protein
LSGSSIKQCLPSIVTITCTINFIYYSMNAVDCGISLVWSLWLCKVEGERLIISGWRIKRWKWDIVALVSGVIEFELETASLERLTLVVGWVEVVAKTWVLHPAHWIAIIRLQLYDQWNWIQIYKIMRHNLSELMKEWVR